MAMVRADRYGLQHSFVLCAVGGDPVSRLLPKTPKARPVAQSYWNPPGAATASLTNSGPHGFTENLYAYTSATGNNGSAFGGLNPNTPWYNVTLGLAMLIGRFLFLIPLLAAAGSLAMKRKIPATIGTLPHSRTIVRRPSRRYRSTRWRTDVLPALALGPIVEHFLMQDGKLFSSLLLNLWS